MFVGILYEFEMLLYYKCRYVIGR
ncbi:hypothetical protein LINPERHAP1_LOCUS15352 [Linum perenne]